MIRNIILISKRKHIGTLKIKYADGEEPIANYVKILERIFEHSKIDAELAVILDGLELRIIG